MNPHTGNPGPPPGQRHDDLEQLLGAIPDPPVPADLHRTLVARLPARAGEAVRGRIGLAAWCAIGGLGLAAVLALVVMFGPRTTSHGSPDAWARRDSGPGVPVVTHVGSISSSHLILKDTNPCRTLPDFCN